MRLGRSCFSDRSASSRARAHRRELQRGLEHNYNNKQGVPMASGPMKLQSYTKGQSLTMVRNTSFFGRKPALDRIIFRFITVTDSEIQAIRGGEVDRSTRSRSFSSRSARSVRARGSVSNAGSTLEHIDYQRRVQVQRPALGQRSWFRQAFAYSLDRHATSQQLFRHAEPDLQVLQSLTYRTPKPATSRTSSSTRAARRRRPAHEGTRLHQGRRRYLRV